MFKKLKVFSSIMGIAHNIKDILKRKGLMFDGLQSDPKSRNRVLEVRERLLKGGDDLEKLVRAANDPEINEIFLTLGPTPVRDISEVVKVNGKGKVYLLDYSTREVSNMRLPSVGFENPVSHKLAMHRNLFLMAIMRGTIPDEGIDTLVDCGIANSMFALRAVSYLTGYKGMQFVPKDFPFMISIDLSRESYDAFIRVLANDHYHSLVERGIIDIENAAFFTLNDALKKGQLPNCCYMGHSELGSFAMYADCAVDDFADNAPDSFVTCIGAGTTIGSIGVALKRKYGTKLIVAEASHYPNLANEGNKEVIYFNEIPDFVPNNVRDDLHRLYKRYESPVRGRSQIVMLGHEGRMNDYNRWAFDDVGKVYLVDDDPFLCSLETLHRKGLKVGRTTAPLVAIAEERAKRGETVVVPSFEPFRDYNPTRNPWLFRGETFLQKAAVAALAIGLSGFGLYVAFNCDPRAPWYMLN
jgi:hypothetical protein